MKHQLIAIKAFPYAGKNLEDGDHFEAVSDNDAFILTRAGRAKRPPHAIETREIAAAEENESATEDRKKRRYRRRDMTAES